MAEEKKAPKKQQIERIFEQPPDAITFYADMAQVVSTGNEIIAQFYESVPGPPGTEGRIAKMRTRLRATITLSFPHAKNLGKLLTERASKEKK